MKTAKAAAWAALLLASMPAAADSDSLRIADGLAVYLGIMPAAMIQGHPQGHAEASMHGGVPRGKDAYHVMAAIFDSATGERVSDAVVEARAAPIGLAGATRRLEPMRIAGAVTYGNYFAMAEPGRYRIVFSITTARGDRPIEMEFAYDHPRP